MYIHKSNRVYYFLHSYLKRYLQCSLATHGSPITVFIMSFQDCEIFSKSHAEIEFLMGRKSIHYLTLSQLYLLCKFQPFVGDIRSQITAIGE